MTTIALVQVSDIHFKGPNDRARKRAAAIAATLNGHPPVSATFICVNGDIAQSGKATEYDVAEAFFTELRTELEKIAASGKVYIVLVPGNHDNDYTSADDAREMLIPQLLLRPTEPRKDGVIELCTDVQHAFFGFMARVEQLAEVNGKNRLFWTRRFDLDGKTVQFNCYNSGWHDLLDDQKRSLTFPVSAAVDADSPSDVTIALLHHPLAWFALESYRAIEAHLEACADVVMTGHEHRAGQYQRSSASDEGTEHYEAGALQPHGNTSESEFNIIFLDLATRRHRHVGYAWNEGKYERRGDFSDWRPYLRNDHLRAGFNFNERFRHQFLDDAGAQFSHNARDRLYFQDIYVPPQLKELRPVAKKLVEVMSARDVLEVAKDDGRALVFGPNWSGKTALCKWMLRALHHDDLVPVYVRASDIVADPDALTAVIERLFTVQYGPARLEEFRQLARTSRALLLDEYEDVKVPKANRDAVFKQLEAYFGVVVVVADDLARIDEISYEKSIVNPLVRYRRFDLQPFGHVLRNALARKWHELSLGTVTDEAVEKRIAQSEGILRAVIATNTVPSLPIFLLVFLQSEEAMRKSESGAPEHSGSFGFLHQELIKKSLVSAEPATDFDTTHKYLAELAYTMFVDDQRTMTLEDIERHHRKYSDDFQLTLDRGRMVAYLVAAGVLREDNGTYSFKYPYLFPFFVAYAVKDVPARFNAHIGTLVDTIHKTENAHILMFLTYFLRDDRVVSHVLERARNLYGDVEPCDMEIHVAFLNELEVEELVLLLPESTPEENGRALREELDRRDLERHETAPTTREEREQAAEEINEVLRINKSMKTIEILGQVLRNFPGSTLGERKREIAEQCYHLALRTMRRLLDLLNQNVTKIVEDFTRALEDQKGLPYHAAHEKAKYGIYALAEMLSFGLIWKTADSVGLQKLGLTFDALVEGTPSVGISLIDLAVRLEHFASFPESKVDKLIKRTKDVPFARGVLKRLVHRHFYLIKRPEDLRQSVCKRLEIKVVRAPVAVFGSPAHKE